MGNNNTKIKKTLTTSQHQQQSKIIKNVYSNQYQGSKSYPLYDENVFLIIHSFNNKLSTSKALEIGCKNNHQNMINYFKKFVPNKYDILMTMCALGNLKNVRDFYYEVVTCSWDTYFKSDAYNDCLQTACKNGQINIVRHFLYNNSHTLDSSVSVSVAFEIACEYGHVECVKILLDNDCDSITFYSIKKGLQKAQKNKHEKVVAFLFNELSGLF